jgi:trans-aconitate methyltransferase
MKAEEVGQSYDVIADQWANPQRPLTGLEPHRRAVQFLKNKGFALDVGCGCNGRLHDYLKSQGFEVQGVDVSQRMIELARKRDPQGRFYHADICQWELPRKYDLITAWDSIWHVQLEQQEAVCRKLCNGLLRQGVFIFTMGGVDEPGEVRDSHMGVPMYTATLGIPKTLALLSACECVCRHLEYDQYPERHVYIIAQKI